MWGTGIHPNFGGMEDVVFSVSVCLAHICCFSECIKSFPGCLRCILLLGFLNYYLLISAMFFSDAVVWTLAFQR